MAKFINTELESESELESEAKLESKSEFSVLQKSDTEYFNVFTHSNYVLNYRWLLFKWLLTDIKRVKNLVVTLLTLNKSKT